MTEAELRRIAVPTATLRWAKVRDVVRSAGVVYGLNSATGKFTLLFGRELLREIVRGRGSEFDPQRIVVFSYDESAGEFAELCQTVAELKRSAEDQPPQDGYGQG